MDVDDSEEDDFLEFLRGCASEEFLEGRRGGEKA
jgi:hypothetical protein